MKEQTSRRDFLGRSLKTGLALAIPTILTRKAKAEDSIVYNKGKLGIYDEVNDYNFNYDSHTTFHWPGGTDCFDSFFDGTYGPQIWSPNTKKTKIISRVEDYKLDVDTRNLDSFTPVDLELSLHSENDTPMNVSNLENWLMCIIDPSKKEWDFSPKPITVWRRFPAEPDKLQFLADIREAFAKSDFVYNDIKYAIVPLPNLDGPYASQDPYDFLQVRFDVYPGNLTFSLDSDGKILDGIVDMKDLAILGNDWGKQGQPLEFVGDITGPQGLPDGKVDYQDLELLTRYWLKDIRDIMASP